MFWSCSFSCCCRFLSPPTSLRAIIPRYDGVDPGNARIALPRWSVDGSLLHRKSPRLDPDRLSFNADAEIINHIMAPPRIARALLALLSLTHLASSLQVTPNSPCASICQDRPEFDISAPASSNTKNSDIFCEDAAHHGAAGSKWRDCMTCLQNSTFYQGAESDQMWFLCRLSSAGLV